MKNKIENYLPFVLKKYRHKTGLSQQIFADYVGISKGYITAIEVGRTIPNVVMLFRLARICGIPVEDIL